LLNKKHEEIWRRRSLQLAFFERRPESAELVRQKTCRFSVKDWFWYQGAKTQLMRPIVLLLLFLFKRQD
jgi:hypothetical protein